MSQRGHILDDAWYLDYASGSLETEAHDVLIASHVELSEDAQERVAVLEQIGGALIANADDADASSLCFSADDILARAGNELAPPLPEPANDVRDGVPIPRALGDYLDRTGTPVRWAFLGPGLRKAILWRGSDGKTLWLLRARPGVSIPHHGHNGSELTLVLKGSFWDGDQQYRAGDLEEAHRDTQHDIRIDDAEECVCLALTEGKLRFNNPLLQAFQLFTGL